MKNWSVHINSTGRPIAFRSKRKSKQVFDHIKEVTVPCASVSFLVKFFFVKLKEEFSFSRIWFDDAAQQLWSDIYENSKRLIAGGGIRTWGLTHPNPTRYQLS